jgi:hypothetical protein
LTIALVGLLASSAGAQLRYAGVARTAAAIFDPCLITPTVTFSASSSSIPLGASTSLNWSVQAPTGCGYSLSMTVNARPQIDPSPGAPQDWDNWTSSTGVAAQPQGSLQVQPAFNTVYQLVVALGPNSTIVSAPITVAVSLPLANRLCHDVTSTSTPLIAAQIAAPASSVTPATAASGVNLAIAASGVNLAAAASTVAPATPPCRNQVTIDASDLAPLLVQALQTPNTTVNVADGVELDLTPHLGGPIRIASGVQLIGGRTALPGKPFQRGPHLFVARNPYVFDSSHWPYPLFSIEGDGVRISGVRIEGPGSPPDAWRSIPQGYAKGIYFQDKINIEIDHNEFSGWNAAAVEAAGIESTAGPSDRVWQTWTSQVTVDSAGLHYPGGIEPVHIHDNYFHNNWYPDSPAPLSSCSRDNRDSCTPYYGYGVVASGTHVLIEQNVFNDYFHAIAADGCQGSGYRAYRNLILANGSGEQAFDAHHRRPSDCGGSDRAAGHDFDVWFNSFLYHEYAAFYINGTPDIGAVVGSNVFANDRVIDSAVVLSNNGDWGKVWTDGNNLEGVTSWDDPSHLSDVCDFDGDGINDHFLTTGETWWFRSGDQSKDPTPWVYLNTNTLLVDSVRLGYFSADSGLNHVCDVAVQYESGYKGGTGQYGPLN